MKKTITAILLMLIMLLTACGTPQPAATGETGAPEPEEETAINNEAQEEQTTVDYEEVREEMNKTAIANPWGDTQSLDVAVESSGVEFTPPEEGQLPGGVELKIYRYMEGTIEADYEGSGNELSIRKSVKSEGKELSGDYNGYSKEWDEEISGITVNCRGDGELINTAVFDADGGHFAISYNIGEEGRGLTVDELGNLIGGYGEITEEGETEEKEVASQYTFRTPELRLTHFTKHGIDMGFTTEDAYEQAASRVITNPQALHKTEAEDGDDVYYVADTNEFVVLSTDGYIRTYFCPDKGKAYFDKQ